MTPLPALSWPVAEEQAFLDRIELVLPNVFRTRLRYEPKAFGGGRELPAVTLYWRTVNEEDQETGPIVLQRWEWRVNVYCDLNRGYEEGQDELKTLIPAVLRSCRAPASLGIDGRWFRISDSGEEPAIDHDEQLIWKSLRLECALEALEA